MVALRNSGVVVGQEDSLVDILRRQGIRIPVGRSAPAELMVGIRPTGEVFDPLAKVKTPFCSTHAGRGRGWDYQGARGPEYLDVIWDNPLNLPSEAVDTGVLHAFVELVRSPGALHVRRVLASEFLELRGMDFDHNQFEYGNSVLPAGKAFVRHFRGQDERLGKLAQPDGSVDLPKFRSLMASHGTRLVEPTKRFVIDGRNVSAKSLGMSRRWTNPRQSREVSVMS